MKSVKPETLQGTSNIQKLGLGHTNVKLWEITEEAKGLLTFQGSAPARKTEREEKTRQEREGQIRARNNGKKMLLYPIGEPKSRHNNIPYSAIDASKPIPRIGKYFKSCFFFLDMYSKASVNLSVRKGLDISPPPKKNTKNQFHNSMHMPARTHTQNHSIARKLTEA